MSEVIFTPKNELNEIINIGKLILYKIMIRSHQFRYK